jgi:uncharacterized Zn-finger protein
MPSGFPASERGGAPRGDNPAMKASALPTDVVEVTASDLKGPGVVCCPNPKMALWSNHPRVFIDLATSGQGKCPYCGAAYKLAGGAASRGGH